MPHSPTRMSADDLRRTLRKLTETLDWLQQQHKRDHENDFERGMAAGMRIALDTLHVRTYGEFGINWDEVKQ